MAIISCGKQSNFEAAPLGDARALEKLAEAYRNSANSLSAAPTSLSPSSRRKFLQQVFNGAGFDYTKTMIALSNIKKPQIDKHYKDLKQLIYLPHFDKRVNKLSDIYTEEEISALTKIDTVFN